MKFSSFNESSSKETSSTNDTLKSNEFSIKSCLNYKHFSNPILESIDISSKEDHMHPFAEDYSEVVGKLVVNEFFPLKFRIKCTPSKKLAKTSQKSEYIWDAFYNGGFDVPLMNKEIRVFFQAENNWNKGIEETKAHEIVNIFQNPLINFKECEDLQIIFHGNDTTSDVLIQNLQSKIRKINLKSLKNLELCFEGKKITSFPLYSFFKLWNDIIKAFNIRFKKLNIMVTTGDVIDNIFPLLPEILSNQKELLSLNIHFQFISRDANFDKLAEALSPELLSNLISLSFGIISNSRIKNSQLIKILEGFMMFTSQKLRNFCLYLHSEEIDEYLLDIILQIVKTKPLTYFSLYFYGAAEFQENALLWKKTFEEAISTFNPNLHLGVFKIILLQKDFI